MQHVSLSYPLLSGNDISCALDAYNPLSKTKMFGPTSILVLRGLVPSYPHHRVEFAFLSPSSRPLAHVSPASSESDSSSSEDDNPSKSSDNERSGRSTPRASPPSSLFCTPRLHPKPFQQPDEPAAPRVALPLPFDEKLVARRVDFGRAVSLAEWARLAEKRRTHLALPDARVSVDMEEEEGRFAGERRVLVQVPVCGRPF